MVRVRLHKRTVLRASLANRTLLIDVTKHFPTYREYETHRLADAVHATFRVPVEIVKQRAVTREHF